MSNLKYKGFRPDWLLTPAPEGSYRSIFRWGDPEFFKYPKESLYKMMKDPSSTSRTTTSKATPTTSASTRWSFPAIP
jgi:hypothetical protein